MTLPSLGPSGLVQVQPSNATSMPESKHRLQLWKFLVSLAVAGIIVSTAFVVNQLRDANDLPQQQSFVAMKASIARFNYTVEQDLSESRTALGNVTRVVARLDNCSQILRDRSALRRAAEIRAQILRSLSSIPLGAIQEFRGTLWYLRQGLRFSRNADLDYARWATAETTTCIPNDHGQASFRDALRNDSSATFFKTTFIGRWNEIMKRYGLQQYKDNIF